MLNIVVINCDGKYVEYEWDSKKVYKKASECAKKYKQEFWLTKIEYHC